MDFFWALTLIADYIALSVLIIYFIYWITIGVWK